MDFSFIRILLAQFYTVDALLATSIFTLYT